MAQKAYEQPGVFISALAGADLSAAQFKIVALNTDGKVVLPAAITANIIGVLQNAPKADQVAKVMVSGVSKVISGATLTAGVVVGTHATAGTAIAAVTTAVVLGTTVTGGSAAHHISVLLNPGTIL